MIYWNIFSENRNEKIAKQFWVKTHIKIYYAYAASIHLETINYYYHVSVLIKIEILGLEIDSVLQGFK